MKFSLKKVTKKNYDDNEGTQITSPTDVSLIKLCAQENIWTLPR